MATKADANILPEDEATTASSTATGKPKTVRTRKRSESQLQRNQATRLQLLEAAGRIIGKYGYAGCTIARVTARAKIAHGTFYLHFQSQQHLFDTVLPVLGSRMLKFIGNAIKDSTDILDLERKGFEANFAYFAKHPYMAKLTNEAEMYAPGAYRKHIEEMASGYARSLLRSKTGTQLANYQTEELERLGLLLIGMRMQLMWQYRMQNSTISPTPPKDLMDTYLKFASYGMFGIPGTAPKHSDI